jgi:hypothetical protein
MEVRSNYDKLLWHKNKVSSSLYGALIYDADSIPIDESQKQEINHGAWRQWEELAELIDIVRDDIADFELLRSEVKTLQAQVRQIRMGYGKTN